MTGISGPVIGVLLTGMIFANPRAISEFFFTHFTDPWLALMYAAPAALMLAIMLSMLPDPPFVRRWLEGRHKGEPK